MNAAPAPLSSARVDARGLSVAAAPLRARRAARSQGADETPTVTRDRRRVQRGGGDRAPAREPARARLPAGQARDRRRLRCLDRPDRRARRADRDREPRVRLLRCPRGGKVAAQNRAVRETSGEILAFSDANATWAPDALAQARPQLRRPGGRVRLRPAAARGRRRHRTARASTGATRCGCASRSPRSARHRRQRLDLRRAAADYVEVDPRFGHDLALPYLMVQRGPPRRLRRRRRSRSRSRTPTSRTEYRRKVRMFEHCWVIVCAARCCGGVRRSTSSSSSRTGYLRYGSGLLHLVLLATSVALASRGRASTRSLLAAQLALLAAAAAAASGSPRYYVLVTWATVVGALELPAPRRARDLGGGRGHPVR